ncbi:unnamed protein product [Rotaria sordida]|nr:unnamed protein product [Rotaria sordida]CAF4103024.1 unnamed protein product [Rotaria sordida]CAF4111052.1 unnamed protein product [Rotaria sordida]
MILPLFRRMLNLEELTLSIFIQDRPFIDGTSLYNEILVYMPRLNMFNFRICTEKLINDSIHHLSKDDIQRTFTNTIFQQVECIVNYFYYIAQFHVFSLSFVFNYFNFIGNTFPTIIFNYVRILRVQDNVPFEHEFFIRIAWSFPLLQQLTVNNIRPQSLFSDELNSNDNQLYSIVNYPYLISLCLENVHNDYAEQFLNDTKTHLPRLTKLIINYDQLQLVTENFTRERTRLNCANVNELNLMMQTIVHSKDFYVYFPLL